MKRSLYLSFFVIVLTIAAVMSWHTFPVSVKKTSFSDLPGWKKANLTPSFTAFLSSCDVFLKQPKAKKVGSEVFPLKVKDFLPACLAAKNISDKSSSHLKAFFEQWFEVKYFSQASMMEGVFTGYYLPTLKGSWQKTKGYQYPIYAKPNNLFSVELGLFDEKLKSKKVIGRKKGKNIVPYYDRKSINEGALEKQGKVLLWVNDKVDRFFLGIQGSGYVNMNDGSQIVLGYAGQNGRSYTSIGRYLIKKGAFDKAHASMQSIRNYLKTHPKEVDEVLNQNKSFIFFKILKKGLVLGSQGASLTPGYSLAVDRQYIPFGVPVWLTTNYRASSDDDSKSLKRLMIAQDTGGAIKGHVRGDVFWGDLPNAATIAGHMNSKGHYWLLLPKYTS